MARFIAFYLPQFHPTAVNDEYWGKGFTEWTNVAKAKPLFRGHHQPHIPADLGFYDLRLPIIREQQAELAREAGVEGFCYWHYWFGNGKQILEKPFEEVLKSGKPDFPFCLGWANEPWSTKSWTNQKGKAGRTTIFDQVYSEEDYIKHFNYVLPAFKDKRYITVDGKPLFYIYRPLAIPDIKSFINLWQDLAVKNGLKGIYFVAMSMNTSFRPVGMMGKGEFRLPPLDEAGKYYQHLLNCGFDAVNSRGNSRAEFQIMGRIRLAVRLFFVRALGLNYVKKFKQKDINKYLFVPEDSWENVFPTIMPNWDRSPRSGKEAVVYTGSTPTEFEKVARAAVEIVKNKQPEHQIIFIQSWNEWGEGNYMEPDLEYGHGYLNALKNSL